MPRFFCDYCDAYLTHDSAPGRQQHIRGIYLPLFLFLVFRSRSFPCPIIYSFFPCFLHISFGF